MYKELTLREKEVLSLVKTGMNNKEIASKLFVSINTIKAHIRTILKKTNTKNRVQLAVFAANSN